MDVTKRDMLRWLVGLPLTIATRAGRPREPRRSFGRVTVRGWIAYRNRTGSELQVLCDGEDVTRRCVMANDRLGLVVLNKHDAAGKFYMDTRGKMAREKRLGDVRIMERVAGPPSYVRVAPPEMRIIS